jgi:hypothetical protein
MKHIRQLRKDNLLYEFKISSKKKTQQLTTVGKLLADTSIGLELFFERFTAISNDITQKFGSTNNAVLKLRGWDQKDIEKKDLYFLRLGNFILQAGMIVHNCLLARFSNSARLIQDNKHAMEIMTHLTIVSFQKYYSQQPLASIKISYPAGTSTSKEDEEFAQTFVPFELIRRAIRDIDNIKVRNHSSVIQNELMQLVDALHKLIPADDLPEVKASALLGEKIRQDTVR